MTVNDPNSPTTTRRAASKERREHALRLRIGGMTFQQIGNQLGITFQSAHALVVHALDDLSKKCAENAEQLRGIELQRLDVAQAAIWGKVINGDTVAITCLLRILERRARLLGLDAPVKQDVTSLGDRLSNVVIYLPQKDEENDDTDEPEPA